MEELKLIEDKDLCLWYKSKSIERGNPYYTSCRLLCSGINEICPRYLSRNTLEEKVKEK